MSIIILLLVLLMYAAICDLICLKISNKKTSYLQHINKGFDYNRYCLNILSLTIAPFCAIWIGVSTGIYSTCLYMKNHYKLIIASYKDG